MRNFEIEIDNLFKSTGFFPEEFTTLLDSLSIEEQPIFITNLYKRITTTQYQRQQGKEQFGVKKVNGKRLFRFSQEDMKQAEGLIPLAGETILTAMREEKDCLKYRATYVFHERKRNEIEFATPEIEQLYQSIINRVEIKNTIQELVDKTSLYSNKLFHFLEFPTEFSDNKLRRFLKDNNFEECFIYKEHYNYFKINTFKLFAEAEKPIVLKIPLVKGKKTALAHKMYQLYKLYEAENMNYSKLDLSKWAYAQILMCNFSEFRKNTGSLPTYDSTLKNVYKQIR